LLFRGQSRRRTDLRFRHARAGIAASWVSIGRRRRRWGSRGGTVVLRPLKLVEPISAAEPEFVRRPGFYVRVGGLGVVAVTLFAILMLRLWALQVIHGREFASAARAQSYRTIYLPTARNPIVDRSGSLLAGTTGTVAITADAESLGTIDANGRWSPTPLGLARLRRLARLADLPPWRLIANIRRSLRRTPFAPAVAVAHPSRDLAFYVDERAESFGGFSVAVLPQRWYPQGTFGGEFLGLLGEVSPPELHELRYEGTRPGQIVGQSGVEASYERVLDRGLARARVPVDARGRIVGPSREVPIKQKARTLQLTIDGRLQRVAERAIRDGIALAHRNGHLDANAGAAVVMNPWNGSIYALASYPTFDQARAARDPKYFESLFGSPTTPLLNRATQGLYPTGSTFKPIVAEAALATGLITPGTIVPCTGSLTVGNVVFHNVEPAINADLDLDQALTISCDTWFYRLGTMFYARQSATGALDMQRWAHLLGLGHRTGIDLPGEYAGVVPTPEWLRRTFRDPAERIWYEGYSVNLAIGQGYLAVTPLQLATAYAALANGGKIVRPHVARAVLSGSGAVVRRLSFRPVRRVELRDDEVIRQALYNAAHAADGTSSAVFGNFPVAVAGKTGTAQTPSGSDHSWYASWAPAGRPQVVVVVLIEHGGFGAEAAAPAAREIYSAFFHVR
jgi:penicillin-binding protein 2